MLHLLPPIHQGGLPVTGRDVQRTQKGYGSVLTTNWAKDTVALLRRYECLSDSKMSICAATWACKSIQTLEGFVLTFSGELSKEKACLPRMI